MKTLYFAFKNGVQFGKPMAEEMAYDDPEVLEFEVNYDERYQLESIENAEEVDITIAEFAKRVGVAEDEAEKMLAFVVPESAKINRWNGFLDYDNPRNVMIRKILDTFEDNLHLGIGEMGGDLHNAVFSESCSYEHDNTATEACESVGIFSAIRLVQKYESDVYGADAKIEPIHIANMVVYIGGEYLLTLSEYLREVVLDEELTEFDLSIIEMEVVEELKRLTLFESMAGDNIDTLIWDYFETY